MSALGIKKLLVSFKGTVLFQLILEFISENIIFVIIGELLDFIRCIKELPKTINDVTFEFEIF
jgi:hypothetical protein